MPSQSLSRSSGVGSRWRVVSLLVALLVRVAAAENAESEPRGGLESSLRLDLGPMASLPSDIVFLGGTLRDDANVNESVLLVSRDGGRSWEASDTAIESSSVLRIQALGISNAWALVGYAQEGVQAVDYLLRTEDAGLTWETIEIPKTGTNPLEWIRHFEFYNERHGVLIVEGSAGKVRGLETRDGGQTWEMMWGGAVDAEMNTQHEFRYPNEEKARTPPHAPLFEEWKSLSNENAGTGFYRIVGLIRCRKEYEAGRYIVETYRYGRDRNAIWEARGEISLGKEAAASRR